MTLAGDENERPIVGQLEGTADGDTTIELDYGLDLREWSLSQATGVSDDGGTTLLAG